ncbi:hypothetical protein [Solwaraspora sp. WMMD792]|uniref:hypothetical protein n=1 Tax=Solwaraspora sp. WMMD792 TaxID=3016099 RepID=UPI0024173B69|nr:hypothetical protein [Solwaraspora sp. WMMD792]MDG4771816.1 hypothetical protein [Solwaraspora sp. WMMD792]
MLTRRPPRLTAVLLVGAVVALSACGPAAEPGDDGDGTTATRAPDAATSPGALPVRDDLVDPQVVAWRSWRAVDDRTLEFTVTAGPADCYGAEPQVQESETAVRVQIRVGRLPEAADEECPAIALESAVLVRLAAPLGDREVEQLN